MQLKKLVQFFIKDYILKTWKRDGVIDKEKWFFQIGTKYYKNCKNSLIKKTKKHVLSYGGL